MTFSIIDVIVDAIAYQTILRVVSIAVKPVIDDIPERIVSDSTADNMIAAVKDVGWRRGLALCYILVPTVSEAVIIPSKTQVVFSAAGRQSISASQTVELIIAVAPASIFGIAGRGNVPIIVIKESKTVDV